MRRITYLNWIVELGATPDKVRNNDIWQDVFAESVAEGESLKELKTAVRQALDCLDEDERFLIIRRFYLGQSIIEISRQSGRAGHRLASLERRAIKKLRRQLATFVEGRFRIQAKLGNNCPICASPDRPAIDALIARRDSTQTWRPVIRALIEEYSIRVSTPMILIGHEKYH